VTSSEIEAWERWVSEMEHHPLDGFEYEEALASRDRASVALEIRGPGADWAELDAIDARFQAITAEDERSPFTSDRPTNTWWRWRLPTSPEHLSYLDIGNPDH